MTDQRGRLCIAQMWFKIKVLIYHTLQSWQGCFPPKNYGYWGFIQRHDGYGQKLLRNNLGHYLHVSQVHFHLGSQVGTDHIDAVLAYSCSVILLSIQISKKWAECLEKLRLPALFLIWSVICTRAWVGKCIRDQALNMLYFSGFWFILQAIPRR